MKPYLIFLLLPVLWLGAGCGRATPAGQPADRTAAPIDTLDSGAGFPVNDAQAAPTEELRVCRAVLHKLYTANGDFSRPMPSVFMTDNHTCMAAFYPRKNAIEIERRTYEVCRSFKADSLHALAIVLSHELSHALEVSASPSAFRSNFWAYSRQTGSSVAREKSADLRGAFMAHLAGYRILSIVPALIQQLYAAYPKQSASAAYPAEEERRQSALEVQGWVDTLIQVFDAANYLLAAGQSDMAAMCYDHVLQQYKSPEIWNNYGIACMLEALRLSNSDAFAYPLELDWQLRLSRPRGATPTEQQMQRRKYFFEQAGSAFAEALKLSPGYFSARLNAWCVAVASGRAQEVQPEILRYLQGRKTGRRELEQLQILAALAAARSGQPSQARARLEQLAATAGAETSALARYNLDVILSGDTRAAVQNSTTLCPVDPEVLELPSVLLLRRMAGAFAGLQLGREGQLVLAWEKNDGRRLLKARIGVNRFCILQHSGAVRNLRLPGDTKGKGLSTVSGSLLLACQEQYFQVFKAGKLERYGSFYAYRGED